uniref:Phytocyanin domain-containing protein n=1 Tax=Ananas comosus var. bracteatus TaxID=296719 RepID=A0A6V7QV70_ANACO
MVNSHGLILVCLALFVAMAGATQFKVGGSKGWSAPDPNAESYNQWAERNRFQIGDTLLFVYPRDKDSVLQVDREAYSTCNTSSYIAKFDDGNTVFTFSLSGPFYFVSGVEANCLKKESLVIVVLADRSNRASQPILAPSPSPSSTLSPPPLIPSPSLAPSEGEVTPPSPSPSEGEGETTAPPLLRQMELL